MAFDTRKMLFPKQIEAREKAKAQRKLGRSDIGLVIASVLAMTATSTPLLRRHSKTSFK